MKAIFCIYDSRYLHDTIKAHLFTVENTFKKAKAVIKEFGDGNVIVKETIKGDEIVKKEIVYVDND